MINNLQGDFMETNDAEIIEFINKVQAWHEHHVSQLKMITDHPDAEINIDDQTIPADSELAKGIRFGVELALLRLGKLPFTTSEASPAEEQQ